MAKQKISEKLSYIQKYHFDKWLQTRQRVAQEESDRNAIFCVCGKLATGLHELNCRKFNDRITKITVERIEKELSLIYK